MSQKGRQQAARAALQDPGPGPSFIYISHLLNELGRSLNLLWLLLHHGGKQSCFEGRRTARILKMSTYFVKHDYMNHVAGDLGELAFV